MDRLGPRLLSAPLTAGLCVHPRETKQMFLDQQLSLTFTPYGVLIKLPSIALSLVIPKDFAHKSAG